MFAIKYFNNLTIFLQFCKVRAGGMARESSDTVIN